MNLPEAHVSVRHAVARMKTLYGQPVFNEWILVKLASGTGAILAYDGPRADNFRRDFKRDVLPLQAAMETRKLPIEDFEFVTDARDTHYDACIRLGPVAYLFCNHTTKTMGDIREDRRWIAAQKPFVDLAAQFRDDPLV